MANKIEFSPAIPIPLVFDVQKRIAELQSFLDPDNPHYQPEGQHTNIRAIIKLYSDGKLDGVGRGHGELTFMHGKVVTLQEALQGKAHFWCEPEVSLVLRGGIRS
jgi:hypothetical protein